MQYFFFIILCSLLLSSCSDDGTSPSANNPEDTIETITIGNQIWMAKNLDVAIFQNGDTIPEAKTPEEWIKAGETKTPTWCYYDFNKENGKIYGKLYNWYVVNDPRKIAPNGFHVPSEQEWNILINSLGQDSAGTKLKSTNNWVGNNSGLNSSGFNGLPGGYVNSGSFNRIGEISYYWSSTGFDPNTAMRIYLSYNSPRVLMSNYFNYNGCSIRCIKD
jgi:uncharacterized protein (TIGR02145 family)